MNAAAKALGMQNSVFRNPHGLPARGHYTHARAILAVLAKAIIAEFPDFYSLYAEREFSYNGIAQHNRNALLWRDPSVDGMKTGYTEAAGYCLVTSAERDGMRLIAVVLGAPSAAVAQRRRAEAARVRLRQLRDAQALFGRASRSTTRAFGAASSSTRGLGLDRGHLRHDPARRVRRARRQHGRDRRACGAARARALPVGEVKISFAGAPLVKSPARRAHERLGRRRVGAHARRAAVPLGMSGGRRVAAEVSRATYRSRCSAATTPDSAPPSSRSSSRTTARPTRSPSSRASRRPT